MGIISSVTQPVFHVGNRLRVSAEGKLFPCLFAHEGHDLRGLLRSGAADQAVREALMGIWRERDDRYSELRGQTEQKKPEMSYLGG